MSSERKESLEERRRRQEQEELKRIAEKKKHDEEMSLFALVSRLPGLVKHVFSGSATENIIANRLAEIALTDRSSITLNTIATHKKDILEHVKKHPDLINQSEIKNTDSDTLLHLVLKNTKMNEAEKKDYLLNLISLGGDITKKDKDLNTVLHLAISSGQLKIAAELLILPNVNTLFDKPNLNGYSPVHLAAQQRSIELVEAMLDRDADINNVNANKESLLHIAARSGDTALVQRLLERGIDPGLKDVKGKTAAQIASENHNDNIAVIIEHAIARVEAERKDVEEKKPAIFKMKSPFTEAELSKFRVADYKTVEDSYAENKNGDSPFKQALLENNFDKAIKIITDRAFLCYDKYPEDKIPYNKIFTDTDISYLKENKAIYDKFRTDFSMRDTDHEKRTEYSVTAGRLLERMGRDNGLVGDLPHILYFKRTGH